MSKYQKYQPEIRPSEEMDINQRLEGLHRDIFGNLEDLIDETQQRAREQGKDELLLEAKDNQALFDQIKEVFRFSVRQMEIKKDGLDASAREQLEMRLGLVARKVEQLFGVNMQLHVPYQHLTGKVS